MSYAPKWSSEEEVYLRRHWKTTPIEELAQHFGRSVKALRTKGYEMGLRGPLTKRWRLIVAPSLTPATEHVPVYAVPHPLAGMVEWAPGQWADARSAEIIRREREARR